jgi:hypothetical protein
MLLNNLHHKFARDHHPRSSRMFGITLALSICLGCASQATSLPPDDRALQRPSSASSSEQQVTLSGWFHVIWNAEPRYMLIDDQGRWTRLVLDGPSGTPQANPLALNRKRVKAVAVPLASPAGAMRIVHIGLE